MISCINLANHVPGVQIGHVLGSFASIYTWQNSPNSSSKLYNILTKHLTQQKVIYCSFLTRLLPFVCPFDLNTYFYVKLVQFKDLIWFVSVFIKCGRIRRLEGGGVHERAVKWSGKNEFWSGKSQWKVREFHFRLRVGTLNGVYGN